MISIGMPYWVGNSDDRRLMLVVDYIPNDTKPNYYICLDDEGVIPIDEYSKWGNDMREWEKICEDRLRYVKK